MDKEKLKFNYPNRWGVVEHLCIEADTREAIIGAVTIALTENRTVTHYNVKEITDSKSHLKGANSLSLLITKGSPTDVELPFELDTVEAITDFIVKWLDKKGKWPHETPDTDGSVEPGFQISKTLGDSYFTVLKVIPTWIIYSK